MGLSKVLQTVLFLEVFQLAVGFVRLDTTPTPSESSVKDHLLNVSLDHLTSRYFSQDVTSLNISGSRFGAIDKNAFDHLIHLNRLEISNTNLQQEIDPQTFTTLPGLETLILKRLGLRRVNLNLTNVQDLNLEQNEIEMFDGRDITGKNVRFLDLSGNKLRVLKGTFANMNKLKGINLSENKLEEVPPVFKQNTQLSTILVTENKIKSTEGLNLPWLKVLGLFSNEIKVLNTESFPRMTFLEILTLSFNHIEHIDDAFKDLVELKQLDLSWNSIEHLDPGLFRNNLYLTKLLLEGNKISSLKKFQNVHPHLTHLDVSHNQLVNIEDDFFLSTPALQVLDLTFNQLKTLGDILLPLRELKVLNLNYNKIVMSGNELLGNHKLTHVNLSSNYLQGGLSHFRNNQLLTELDLSNNKISDICDGTVVPKGLLKLNLKENKIKNLNCLNELKSLCEVDFRDNPLTCGEQLDDLILNITKRKGAPYVVGTEFQVELPSNQECEDLTRNHSFSLWNSVRRELCPNGRDLESKVEEEWGSEEVSEKNVNDSEETKDTKEPVAEDFEMKKHIQETKLPEKQFLIKPLGWIKNDEMNKPNPLQNPQSGRLSWGSIDENSGLLNGFEDEEIEKKPRFSWYTIALILIGLSLTLTFVNLVVFLYIRLNVWKRAEASSQQKYTVLHNEVYKNTTEPSKACPGDEWVVENGTRNKMFTFGKINEILLNFGPNKKDKDSESAKNILINSSNGSQNF